MQSIYVVLKCEHELVSTPHAQWAINKKANSERWSCDKNDFKEIAWHWRVLTHQHSWAILGEDEADIFSTKPISYLNSYL